MRLGEISKPESDDLFGSENPLDRLRKFIRLKIPVYFEHGDDPPGAYRHHVIVMANEQNFVYTTNDRGMAYVPWVMPATRHHGGVKLDDWRFVQRNSDWILQQHMSEPPLSEDSDDVFGPQRKTLTAREMSRRMNLAAQQVGLDNILFRSGLEAYGFEYHPLASINQDGFQWVNRNGTPIWATWEGEPDLPRRWQYYRSLGSKGEYIFHAPVYDNDDDLDENQDDDLFEPSGNLKVVSYDIPQEMVYIRSSLGLLGVKILNWDVIDNHYFTVDDHEVRSVNNHDVVGQDNRNWYTAELGVEVADKFEKYADDWLNAVIPDDVRQAMAEKYFLEESDDNLFEPTTSFVKIVNYDIPRETVFVRSALGIVGVKITGWDIIDNFFTVGGVKVISINYRPVTDLKQRRAIETALNHQVYEQEQEDLERWITDAMPDDVLDAMTKDYEEYQDPDDINEDNDDLFAPPGKFQKIRQAILDTAKYYGAQLDYFENSPQARQEVDSETVDALHEYIGQARYVLKEFTQGGIAALDNALSNVYPEVVDSIEADLYTQGIVLDNIIRQHRNSLQENHDLFGEIPTWKQVDRLIKAGQPVLFQWIRGVFYPVVKSNQYGFYWTNSNGLDINTPWGTYTDPDDNNWNLTSGEGGAMILTDPDFLEESDDLFSEVNPMSRLRSFHEQGREIKIADQNGNVWTAVKFLRGEQTGQPLMQIQREYQSGYNRHTEQLNMTENGLEGADIRPGPGGKIFVYLKPFERTTIEEQDNDDLFGEPTQRSQRIQETLPIITQMMLALRQQNYQRATGLATAHHLEIPPEYLIPAMTALLQNQHYVSSALSYLTKSVHQRIPELEPLLLDYIRNRLVNEPSAENFTVDRAVEYLSKTTQARIPGLEEILLSLRTVRQKSSAKHSLKAYGLGNPAADQWIIRTLLPTWKNPESTAEYLSQVHRGQRIQALEPIVLLKADPALKYAAHNLKQRWPRAEAIIGSNGEAAYYYALYFLKPNRWVEAEPAIARDRVAWSMYARDFLGVNNHTKKGREQRDAWRAQVLAGQPLTPAPQGANPNLEQQVQRQQDWANWEQQNQNPINEDNDELFGSETLQQRLQQKIKQLFDQLYHGGEYGFDSMESKPVFQWLSQKYSDMDDPIQEILINEPVLVLKELAKELTDTIDQNNSDVMEEEDDLFGPAKLPSVARLKNMLDVQNINLIDGNRSFEVYDVNAIPDDEFERMAVPGMIGWYEFQVNDPDQQGIHVRILDPKELMLDTSQTPYVIKPRPIVVESDDDIFEPGGVTPEKINRLLQQHDIIYLQLQAGVLYEIEEAMPSECPGDIELALTTEWGETILRNFPKDYLSIDYSQTPPRVVLGKNQLEESKDLFGEPTKMAYVSRLVTALKNYAQEFSLALSDEEKKNIKYAIGYYEKGDFIAGNAYLFDLYEDNLERLKQYLWDRNLTAAQQHRLPGTLTLREHDNDLFEPMSPKKIAMALSSAIDAVVDMIGRDPIGTMDSGDRATRELQLLGYIKKGVLRGHLKGALGLMLDLEDNVQEEIAHQLRRHSGLDIHTLRGRYLDESDEDLFEPNQRLQIYRAIREIADRFEELNTPNLESMQDLVERYRRVADEFRKSMDQGYRSIWHILSGKYYWQRDLLFDNLKTPYGIDIEDQFLDWTEQVRQQQN